ncbi:hypothetical protein GS416_05470 [Rhodococcus hoagii]|nr:hypothetical protein [Prescottella equi]
MAQAFVGFVVGAGGEVDGVLVDLVAGFLVQVGHSSLHVGGEVLGGDGLAGGLVAVGSTRLCSARGPVP